MDSVTWCDIRQLTLLHSPFRNLKRDALLTGTASEHRARTSDKCPLVSGHAIWCTCSVRTLRIFQAFDRLDTERLSSINVWSTDECFVVLPNSNVIDSCGNRFARMCRSIFSRTSFDRCRCASCSSPPLNPMDCEPESDSFRWSRERSSRHG